jgi:hypothetical protein
LAAAVLAALVLPASSVAQPPADQPSSAEVAERDRWTSAALLAGFLKRRAEVVQAPGSAESKRYALDYLDRQIAQLRSRIERLAPAEERRDAN